jgi:hypothetical protein
MGHAHSRSLAQRSAHTPASGPVAASITRPGGHEKQRGGGDDVGDGWTPMMTAYVVALDTENPAALVLLTPVALTVTLARYAPHVPADSRNDEELVPVFSHTT